MNASVNGLTQRKTELCNTKSSALVGHGEISSSPGQITASVVRGIDYWVSKTFCFICSFSSQHFMHWLLSCATQFHKYSFDLDNDLHIYTFSMHTNTHSTHKKNSIIIYKRDAVCIEYTIFDIWYFYQISANEWMVCEWFHWNEGRKSLKFSEKGCTKSYISADAKSERFLQRDRKFIFDKFGLNSRFTDDGPYYYFSGIYILYNEFD